jgi:hypothetical protein
MKWEQIAALALKLPAVEESTSYGRPALKVAGKGIVFWNNPEDVVFQLTSVDEQQFLIEVQPEVYYITPHYIGWPSVRARLKKLTGPEAKHRIEQAWLVKATPKLLKQLAAEGALPAFAKDAAPAPKAKKAAPPKAAPKKATAKKAPAKKPAARKRTAK